MTTYLLEIAPMKKTTTIERSTPFGQWLTDARIHRGLTMEAVAERGGTTQGMVSSLERGTRNPSRDMVYKLAEALSGSDYSINAAKILLRDGLTAAGFLPTKDLDEDIDPLRGDPLETIMKEAGFNPDMLREDDLRQLRQNINAVVIGTMEQEKRKKAQS
jgi:transcriptional regulator with XRE-family HTH domain